MTDTTSDLVVFIQTWMGTPYLTYRHVDSPDGKERVNRAYDRLFAVLMYRRSAAGDGDITNA